MSITVPTLASISPLNSSVPTGGATRSWPCAGHYSLYYWLLRTSTPLILVWAFSGLEPDARFPNELLGAPLSSDDHPSKISTSIHLDHSSINITFIILYSPCRKWKQVCLYPIQTPRCRVIRNYFAPSSFSSKLSNLLK